MPKNPIEFDITDTLDKFTKLQDQNPFIISKSMNDVAFEKGRKDLSKEINKDLDIKTKTVARPNNIKVIRSKKTDLSIVLYYQLGKDKNSNINKYFGLQQFGGSEKPENKKIAIPIRKNMRLLGVPISKPIPDHLKIDEIMKYAPIKPRRNQTFDYKYKKFNIFILDSGVFFRAEENDGDMRMLYTFVDQAKHGKKNLKFQEATIKTYERNFERYYKRNFLRILKG